MAYITRLYELESLESTRPHSKAECSWRVSSRGAERVLQLDTYGSPTRKDVGTVSQSIQLDERSAADLMEVIRSVFPTIEGAQSNLDRSR